MMTKIDLKDVTLISVDATADRDWETVCHLYPYNMLDN